MIKFRTKTITRTCMVMDTETRTIWKELKKITDLLFAYCPKEIHASKWHEGKSFFQNLDRNQFTLSDWENFYVFVNTHIKTIIKANKKNMIETSETQKIYSALNKEQKHDIKKLKSFFIYNYIELRRLRDAFRFYTTGKEIKTQQEFYEIYS